MLVIKQLRLPLLPSLALGLELPEESGCLETSFSASLDIHRWYNSLMDLVLNSVIYFLSNSEYIKVEALKTN